MNNVFPRTRPVTVAGRARRVRPPERVAEHGGALGDEGRGRRGVRVLVRAAAREGDDVGDDRTAGGGRGRGGGGGGGVARRGGRAVGARGATARAGLLHAVDGRDLEDEARDAEEDDLREPEDDEGADGRRLDLAVAVFLHGHLSGRRTDVYVSSSSCSARQ